MMDRRRVLHALAAWGFSLFEGFQVTGWPRLAMRRGEIVYRDGAIQAAAGSGRVLSRGPTALSTL